MRLEQAYHAGNLRRLIIHRLRRPFINPAAYIWRRLLFKTTFIAVSGSVGKTTTKELLFTILKSQHSTMCSQGSRNAQQDRGMAMSLLAVRPWHRFAVIEMGVQRPGDMAKGARILKPDVALLLDIKGCHLNVFRNLEALAAEKSQLLKSLRPTCVAVVNQDNALIAAMLPELKCRVVRFGRDAAADFRLLEAESRWPRRLSLSIEALGVRHDIETQLVGKHWSGAILAAIATADHCGVDVATAKAAVATLPPFWARLQPVALPSGATILRDDFQGSFDTLQAAFEVLREATAERKIVVLSDYTDSMAKTRVRARRLGETAAELADMAVFVGGYAERSAKAAVAAGLDPDAVHICDSAAQASDVLRDVLRQGDLVLLKGPTSHHISRVHLGLVGPVTCRLDTCPRMRLCDQCRDLGFQWTPERDGLMAPADSGL